MQIERFPMPSKILVTGAGGMIGSHMAETLHQKGAAVQGTYYKPTVRLSELNAEIPMRELDIRSFPDVCSVICDLQPAVIYHFAAQSYPLVSLENPQETMETNVIGTVNLFEAVKSVRKKDSSYDPLILVACSSAEYGESPYEDGRPEKETDALKPVHPYGVSKAAQDMIAYSYFLNDHIRCIRARIFNTTGIRKTGDVASDLVRRTVLAERSGNYEIALGNPDTRRAILDQRDTVNALLLLAEKGKCGEVYNVSSERLFSARDLVRIIEREIGHRLILKTDPGLVRRVDEKQIAGDVGRLKKDTGWSQKISMEETVKDMLCYWRKR